MTILSRYVLKIFLSSCGVSLASFSSIYLIIDFFEKIARFGRNGGNAASITLFFLFQGIDVICQMTPLALLLASVLTIGALVRTSELTVIHMAGVSTLRLSLPLLLTGLIASIILLLFSETALPGIRTRKSDLKALLSGKKPPSVSFRQNDIWYRDREAIISATQFLPDAGVLLGVSVMKFDTDFNLTERVDAARANLSEGILTASGVTVYRFEAGGLKEYVEHPTLTIPTSLTRDDLRELEKSADAMSFRVLREYTRKLERTGYRSPRWETLMHARLAEPFTSFVMTLAGIPFAIRNARSSGPARGIALTIVTGFTFYVLNALSVSLGQSGMIPPVIAGWGVPILFLLLGTLLLKRLSG